MDLKFYEYFLNCVAIALRILHQLLTDCELASKSTYLDTFYKLSLISVTDHVLPV